MTHQEWEDCRELSDLHSENTVLKEQLAAALAENTKLAKQVQVDKSLTCDGCAYKKDYGKCAACDYCIRHEGYKDRYNVRLPEAGETE